MTQEYVGTKIVTAWSQAKDGTPGYAVKYSDGYTSWSPADVFEAAYIPLGNIGQMPPHQQRVIAEKAGLDDQLGKLKKFFDTAIYVNLDFDEKDRLSHQAVAMQEYSAILGERIAAF